MSQSERVAVDLPWRTIFRILAVIMAVWIWLQVWQIVMALIVSVIIAVALHPVVRWLEDRRVPRWLGATSAVLILAVICVWFVAAAWSSVTEQATIVGRSLAKLERDVRVAVPVLNQALGRRAATDEVSMLREYGSAVAASTFRALLLIALGLVLTIYLVIEREKTVEWALAFVPRAHQPRARRTLEEAYEVVLAYVAGNIATSIFAAVTVFVALTLLHVPAALLLALLAGIFDFVPVLGFIASAAPAVLLGFTVSRTVAVLVLAVYVGYHFLENYVIGPLVYRNRLRLSNVAILVAFALGAELGGVIGALLALPIAAIYPCVERVWFTGETGRDLAARHTELEHVDALES
jgi:predicted PurR-regulated permease PerM